tara:strand:- start:1668 stop:1907 length:240 start_codon:yes stop_codon:yes gene_type:complete
MSSSFTKQAKVVSPSDLDHKDKVSELKSNEKLTVQDTEFILRKMLQCSYDGSEIMPASKTIGKITAIHQKLLELEIDAS